MGELTQQVIVRLKRAWQLVKRCVVKLDLMLSASAIKAAGQPPT